MRRATLDDLEAVAVLTERLVAFDAQFGWVTVRPSTPAAIRLDLAHQVLVEGGHWCWVAELDGAVTGMVTVMSPARCEWIAQQVHASPVAYVGTVFVPARARGRGVASALIARVHAHAAAAGVRTMTLHHALPNPLSTVFWARQGYRPIYTQWTRHLA
ncbi:GNAT family N-acetyltransferase [Nonomuraea sp. NN258]|nr:GNAT family N-acetyltransferase [Nonomuraea antri]